MSLIKTIVGVVVGIILLSCVAIPIVSEMAKNTETPVYSDNETFSYKMKYDDSASVSIAKTADGFTIGGTEVTTSYLIVTSTAAFQILAPSGSVTGANFLVKTGENTTNFLAMAAMATGSTLVFSGHKWTYTPADGSTIITSPVTQSFDWAFYPDDNGTYIRCSQPVNVDENSKIVAFGFTSNTGHSVSYGTMDSMSIAYTSDGTNNPVVVSEKSGYTYNVTGFNVTHSGSTASQSANLIVPLKYTSDMEKGVLTTIVTILPVLLIVALLISVVGVIITRQTD